MDVTVYYTDGYDPAPGGVLDRIAGQLDRSAGTAGQGGRIKPQHSRYGRTQEPDVAQTPDTRGRVLGMLRWPEARRELLEASGLDQGAQFVRHLPQLGEQSLGGGDQG